MSNPLHVLIVEDSQNDADLIVHKLRSAGYDFISHRVDTVEAMSTALDQKSWDMVISDFMMPRFSGLAALELLKEKSLDIPFIIVSGKIGEETAVEAMKAGANDYIMKQNLARLGPAVKRELLEAAVRRDHKQAENMVKHLAYYDALTSLPNRFLLQDRLKQTILQREQEKKSLALLIMDLDHFNEINDTLGHQYGDVILQQVGNRLREVVWEQDSVARLGGDEFAVLLSRLAAKKDIHLASSKILRALEKPVVIEEIPIAVEASIGVAVYPDHGTEVNALLQAAGIAMHVSKKTGSGCIFYAHELNTYSERRLALMGGLRQAIENGELTLYYQPKIDFKKSQIIGAEALVRWKHPRHGMIPPDQFIAPAEQTALIKPLTQWVLNEALRQCQEWHQRELMIPVAVNLSARNLLENQLPEQIEELIRNYHAAPDWLQLEITESAIMVDPKRALENVTYLDQMGAGLSIDDFGTGYSSLAYLRKLPVDEIKIDKLFVMGMLANKEDMAIVRSTIDLAHNLGLKVVAEGVETKEIWDQLVTLGCDAAQGYYMSRPLPPETFMSWVKESAWGMKQA